MIIEANFPWVTKFKIQSLPLFSQDSVLNAAAISAANDAATEQRVRRGC